ncbi:MAG: hypothetical protein ABEJ99_01170 [Candidatus Nanohaloarchaea archaeon]
MKEELVRIHARLCGDGYAAFYETSETDRDRRAIVAYTNLVDENLIEFQKDMKAVFGVEMYRYKDEVKVKSVRIVEELQEEFGDFSCNMWRVDPRIFDLSRKKKTEWLRAFIRDEGHYESKYRRLRIKSMNKAGLEDIKRLMQSIEVRANLTGPNCDGSHYLNVSGIDNYPKIYKIAENKPKIR